MSGTSNLRLNRRFVRLPQHARHLILMYEVKKLNRLLRQKNHRHPKRLDILFQGYKNYCMLIRLRLWCMTSQAKSLMDAQYAREPRDPE